MNSTADDLQALVKAAPLIDINLDADSPLPETKKTDVKVGPEANTEADADPKTGSESNSETEAESEAQAEAQAEAKTKHKLRHKLRQKRIRSRVSARQLKHFNRCLRSRLLKRFPRFQLEVQGPRQSTSILFPQIFIRHYCVLILLLRELLKLPGQWCWLMHRRGSCY